MKYYYKGVMYEMQDYNDDTEYDKNNLDLINLGLIFGHPITNGNGIEVEYKNRKIIITPSIIRKMRKPLPRYKKDIKYDEVPAYSITDGRSGGSVSKEKARAFLKSIKSHIDGTTPLEEVYSNSNSSLLGYVKDDDIDIGEYPYSEFFHDWMFDHDEEALRKFEDEYSWDDIHEVIKAFPNEVKKFTKDVRSGKYNNEPDMHGKTKVHMSLEKKQLIPRTTWLVHFSDNASQIVANGFTQGAEDMTDLALTKHINSKKYPGYNFVFIADSTYANRAAANPYSGRNNGGGKYGKDAVMFMNSGVHFYHYGDEEDQIVFYGPEVNDFILLDYSDGKYKVHGNYNYKGHDYLFVPNEDTNSFKQCVEWVKTNWKQYSKVLLFHVNTKRTPISEGFFSSLASAAGDGVLKGMGFGEVPGRTKEAVTLPKEKDHKNASRK